MNCFGLKDIVVRYHGIIRQTMQTSSFSLYTPHVVNNQSRRQRFKLLAYFVRMVSRASPGMLARASKIKVARGHHFQNSQKIQSILCEHPSYTGQHCHLPSSLPRPEDFHICHVVLLKQHPTKVKRILGSHLQSVTSKLVALSVLKVQRHTTPCFS